MKKIQLMVLVVMLLSATVLSAQDSETSIETKQGKETTCVPGFIFNTSNLLLDLDSYLGGVGIKLLYPEYTLRLMASVGFQTSTVNTTEVSLGLAYEKPFFRGRISPYTGVCTVLDLTHESLVTDADTWTKTMSLTGEAGALLGVEVFLADFLSLFAEYELSVSLAWTRISQNSAGTLSDPVDAVNYNVNTGLGNSASIGIVIYLKPTGILPEDSEEQS